MGARSLQNSYPLKEDLLYLWEKRDPSREFPCPPCDNKWEAEALGGFWNWRSHKRAAFRPWNPGATVNANRVFDKGSGARTDVKRLHTVSGKVLSLHIVCNADILSHQKLQTRD